MPILKLISYRNKSDFRPSVMGKVMAYCLQPTKTKLREEVFVTSGQNCVPRFAYEQFMTTKEYWHKTDGLCFRPLKKRLQFPKKELESLCYTKFRIAFKRFFTFTSTLHISPFCDWFSFFPGKSTALLISRKSSSLRGMSVIEY